MLSTIPSRQRQTCSTFEPATTGPWPAWSKETTGDGPGPILNRMHKYVMSTTLTTAPWKESTIISGNVVEEITRLKQQPGKDIIIDGSASLVQSLMRTDLIDEYRFLVQPFVMGRGRRFFRTGLLRPSCGLSKVSRSVLDRLRLSTSLPTGNQPGIGGAYPTPFVEVFARTLHILDNMESAFGRRQLLGGPVPDGDVLLCAGNCAPAEHASTMWFRNAGLWSLAESAAAR
jgi:dihydrofolate reductase